MRFGLIDMLFLIGCIAIGTVLGLWLAPDIPATFRPLAGPLAAAALYLVSVYPFYRGFKLFPLILPRCPCCANSQPGFHFVHGWPRVVFRCPTCKGEFVIWHTGK